MFRCVLFHSLLMKLSVKITVVESCIYKYIVLKFYVRFFPWHRMHWPKIRIGVCSAAFLCKKITLGKLLQIACFIYSFDIISIFFCELLSRNEKQFYPINLVLSCLPSNKFLNYGSQLHYLHNWVSLICCPEQNFMKSIVFQIYKLLIIFENCLQIYSIIKIFALWTIIFGRIYKVLAREICKGNIFFLRENTISPFSLNV